MINVQTSGKANPSESPEFTPGSNEVPVVRSLFFYLLLFVFRPFILFLVAIAFNGYSGDAGLFTNINQRL
jgi:hypothetical protein